VDLAENQVGIASISGRQGVSAAWSLIERYRSGKP
jgi:hypothetical protein